MTNKYLEKIAEKHGDRESKSWANLGMTRNQAGVAQGVASTPGGALFGAAGGYFGTHAFIKNQSKKAILEKNLAKSFSDASDATRRTAEEYMVKDRPKAVKVSKSRELVPSTARPLHGEYIPKDSKAIPNIDASIDAHNLSSRAQKSYNKYTSRITKALKAQPYLTAAGAVAGGYAGYKLGNAAGKIRWDINEKAYGGDK